MGYRLACVLALTACTARALPTPDGAPDLAVPLAPIDLAAPRDLGPSDGPRDLESAIPPPRALAPLSTARATSRRPGLRWSLAAGTDGAEVSICADRGCSNVVMVFLAAGQAAQPPSALSPGLYFWQLRGRAGGVTGTVASPAWELVIGARSAAVNTAFGTFPDVNGDGYADVLVGGHKYPTQKGSVKLYLGGPSGVSTTPITVAVPSTDYGATIASAGDVDGDGYADVIIGGAGTAVANGATCWFAGGPSGLSTVPHVLPLPNGGPNSVGCSVASAGDVNGDGYADVMVGGCRSFGGPGGSVVYLGGPSGLTTPAITLAAASGNAVASGDLDGDGYSDLAFASPTAAQGGTVNVYLGGPLGPSLPLVVLDGQTAGGLFNSFGNSIAIGDLDGDGRGDLAVGGPASVFVYFGTPTGLSSTPTKLAPAGVSGDFGAALAAGGDLDGDGYGDLIAGSQGDAGFQGATWVYLGGPSGPSTPIVLAAPTSTYGTFGQSTALGGDINRDGFDDLVVGAGGYMLGAGFVFLGTSSGISTPPTELPGQVGVDFYFGEAVATRRAVRLFRVGL